MKPMGYKQIIFYHPLVDDKTNTPPAKTPETGNKEGDNVKGGQGGSNAGDDKGKGKENQPITLTAEELQAEKDRIAIKTREEEKRKTERAVAKAREEATAEAERLAKLDEAARAEELSKKKEKELQKWENDLTMEKNRNEVMKKLSEAKISNLELANSVTSLDLDKSLQAADDLIASINKEVEAQIQERLKGKPTKDFKGNSDTGAVEISTNI